MSKREICREHYGNGLLEIAPNCRWHAYYWDDPDARGGWGATEEAAIADLKARDSRSSSGSMPKTLKGIPT